MTEITNEKSGEALFSQGIVNDIRWREEALRCRWICRGRTETRNQRNGARPRPIV